MFWENWRGGQCCIQKKLGTFSAGGLVYFPQYQQKSIDLYYFAHFQSFLFSCIRCSSFEQNTRKLIVYLRNLQENNIFFFSSSFFWVLITCECYHFQSGCDPEGNLPRRTLWLLLNIMYILLYLKLCSRPFLWLKDFCFSKKVKKCSRKLLVYSKISICDFPMLNYHDSMCSFIKCTMISMIYSNLLQSSQQAADHLKKQCNSIATSSRSHINLME